MLALLLASLASASLPPFPFPTWGPVYPFSETLRRPIGGNRAILSVQPDLFWPCDDAGATADEVINGASFDGTYGSGATVGKTTIFPNGLERFSFRTDGTANGNFVVAHNATLDAPTTATYGFWLRVIDGVNTQGVWAKDACGVNRFGFAVMRAAGLNSLLIYLRPGISYVSAGVSGTEHFWSFDHDADDILIYANGVLNASLAFADASGTANAAALTVGSFTSGACSQNGLNNNGVQAVFRVARRLSAGEHAMLYRQALGGVP
jgi:hypothetical protein